MSTSSAHAHEEVHHELTTMPFWVGVGAFLTMLGIAYMPQNNFQFWFAPIPGVIVFTIAALGWAAHDIKTWENTPRQWEGKHIGWWGMMFFLATELMTFGALFAAYFAKRAAAGAEWLPEGVHVPVTIALINTALLITSGLVLHWGEVQLKKTNDRSKLALGLAGAILLGLIFLVIQGFEYYELIVHEGVTLTHSTWSNTFFVLTGMHGFHVFVGLVILGTMLVRTLAGNFDKERHVAVTAGAIYWHFVDIVWIFLVMVIYLGVI